jgi:hypothetical protein
VAADHGLEVELADECDRPHQRQKSTRDPDGTPTSEPREPEEREGRHHCQELGILEGAVLSTHNLSGAGSELLDRQLVEASDHQQDRRPSQVLERLCSRKRTRSREPARQGTARLRTLEPVRNSGIYAIYIDGHYAALPSTGQAFGLSETSRKYVVETSRFTEVAALLWRESNDGCRHRAPASTQGGERLVTMRKDEPHAAFCFAAT